ncbi:MAG: Hsp20/alpha crystallin family protein [Actinomycetota bacterium]
MRVRPYDPFRNFDRIFTAASAPSAPSIPLDVVRGEDNVELHFDLPGVDAASIDLTVEKRELTLTAERTFSPAEGAEVVRTERRHGSLTRSLVLAENLDTEALSADYANGVLVVTIPVVAEAKPRRIEIGGVQAELSA